MIKDVRERMNRLFDTDKVSEEKTNEYQSKIKAMDGTKEYNPFLDKSGNLINKYIDYQGLLDNPNVNKKAKEYISNATGLTASTKEYKPQTATKETVSSPIQPVVPQKQEKLGFISAKYETGGWDGGKISSGTGDYGGISYGIPQFSTKTGSADNFVDWLKRNHKEIGNYFGDYKAGTEEFSNAWREAAKNYGDTFSNYQTQYAYDSYVKPLIELAKQKTGVDYTRSPALRELVYSTAIQFGGGNLGLSALGDVNASMSDKDIVNASYDKKINNYKNYFKSSSSAVQKSVRNRFENEREDVLALLGDSYTQSLNRSAGTISKPTLQVGARIANTSSYNNSAARGQCVWYVRGRMKEKLGIDTGPLGNANEMWYNVKTSARLAPSAENIKPDTIATYQTGTSPSGAKYGHVIYIEDVVGDTVYYTEGGSSYYKNGTDGVVKTASKQDILNGVNSNGGKIGSGLIGFIDLQKV